MGFIARLFHVIALRVPQRQLNVVFVFELSQAKTSRTVTRMKNSL